MKIRARVIKKVHRHIELTAVYLARDKQRKESNIGFNSLYNKLVIRRKIIIIYDEEFDPGSG